MSIVLMPEVGILFLIRFNFSEHPLQHYSLNARGGHFVFNTQKECERIAHKHPVLMPEVGILFLILVCL